MTMEYRRVAHTLSLIALRDRRHLRAFTPLAVAGHISLFPLLFTPAGKVDLKRCTNELRADGQGRISSQDHLHQLMAYHLPDGVRSPRSGVWVLMAFYPQLLQSH